MKELLALWKWVRYWSHLRQLYEMNPDESTLNEIASIEVKMDKLAHQIYLSRENQLTRTLPPSEFI